MSDIYKAVIPLNYLGPEVPLTKTSSITINTSVQTQITWSATASMNFTDPYTDDRVIFMDNIIFSERSVLTTNSSLPGRAGIFNYNLTLNHGTDQVLSKYCKFQFKFTFRATNAVTPMTVNVTVITPFNTRSGKKLTTIYSDGISTQGLYTTPAFYVDWEDTTQLTNYAN